MICLFKKLLKAFFLKHSFSCSKIVTEAEILISKNTQENSKLPSYIYFLLPAELCLCRVYFQMDFQTHSIFFNEADLQFFITESSGFFLLLQTFYFYKT